MTEGDTVQQKSMMCLVKLKVGSIKNLVDPQCDSLVPPANFKNAIYFYHLLIHLPKIPILVEVNYQNSIIVFHVGIRCPSHIGHMLPSQAH